MVLKKWVGRLAAEVGVRKWGERQEGEPSLSDE